MPLRRWLLAVGGLLLLLLYLPVALHAHPGLVGQDVSLVVLTGSMEPTYSPGDMIFGAEPEPGSFEVGDVIAFKLRGEPVTTHRIVDVLETTKGQRYTTQGDANNVPDKVWVKPEEVIAKITYGLPGYGYVKAALLHPIGLMVLVWPPAIYFGHAEIKRLTDATTAAADAKKKQLAAAPAGPKGSDRRLLDTPPERIEAVRLVRPGRSRAD